MRVFCEWQRPNGNRRRIELQGWDGPLPSIGDVLTVPRTPGEVDSPEVAGAVTGVLWEWSPAPPAVSAQTRVVIQLVRDDG